MSDSSNSRFNIQIDWTPQLKIIATLLILVVLGGAIYGISKLFTPAFTPPWRHYPTDPQALVSQFFQLIEQDTDTTLNQAYSFQSLSVKNPQDGDEINLYRQLYHGINSYLRGEIGANWSAQGILTFQPVDPAADPSKGPTTYVVSIGRETLHITVAPQEIVAQIPNKPTQFTGPLHYGIVEITELPVDLASSMRQMAGINGIINGIAGKGGSRDLNTVVSLGGRHQRESAMQTKMRVLPMVRNPESPTNRRALLELWPVRKDAVVKARLESIINDERYLPIDRHTAQEVLEERVAPEDLMAIGVDIN